MQLSEIDVKEMLKEIKYRAFNGLYATTTGIQSDIDWLISLNNEDETKIVIRKLSELKDRLESRANIKLSQCDSYRKGCIAQFGKHTVDRW